MKILFCILFSILFCNTSYSQNVDSLINAEIDNAKKSGIMKEEYYQYENQLREMLRKKSNEYDYASFESYLKRFFSNNNNNNRGHSTYKGKDGFTWEATCNDMKGKSVSNEIAFYNDDIEVQLSFSERTIFVTFFNKSNKKIIVPWEKTYVSSTLTKTDNKEAVVYGNDFSFCSLKPFDLLDEFYKKKQKTASFDVSISYVIDDVRQYISINVIGKKE